MERRIALFITARLESSRLKEKHLLPVGGKPILSWLLSRLAREFSSELAAGEAKIVIVSADTERNRAFGQFTGPGVEVFWGHEENIPFRHLDAMRVLNFQACVSIDGDDILCSPTAVRQVYAALRTNSQLVSQSGLPFGMNCFGYARDLLAKALASRNPRDALSTGWGRVFEDFTNERQERVCSLGLSPEENEKLRFTLDYPEDYEFFSQIYAALGPEACGAKDGQICRVALERNLCAINSELNKEYWQNFNRHVAREKESSSR